MHAAKVMRTARLAALVVLIGISFGLPEPVDSQVDQPSTDLTGSRDPEAARQAAPGTDAEALPDTQPRRPRIASAALEEDEPPIDLCVGRGVTRRFEHALPPQPPELDVVLAFDTTGSMGGIIAEMKSKGEEVLRDVADRFPDARFGVASFRDYPFSPYGSKGDVAWQVEQEISASWLRARNAIRGLAVGGGGDGPESYSRVLFEAAHPDNSLGWRSSARRVLIVLGDNYPHDDDLNEGVPYPQPVNPGATYRTGVAEPWLDPGRSGDRGNNRDTSDDIDFQSALVDLRDREVTLLVVMNSWGRVAGGTAKSPVERYWDHWAGQTAPGGFAIGVGDPIDVADAVLELVDISTRRIGNLQVRADPVLYADWLESEPPDYRDVSVPTEGLTLGFDVTVSPPAGTAPGDYTFDLVMAGDGAEYKRRKVLVRVSPPCTETPTPTPTITPSATPSPTNTPSPTPTPTPRSAYLPVIHRECVPKKVPIDLVMVIDTSSSMTGGKVEAAKSAALSFVDAVASERDHVAVVAFDREARIALPLSADLERVRQAIAALETRRGTRIDRGLESAAAVLSGSGARAGADRVIVLLTDGRTEAGSEAPMSGIAAELREGGVDIWVIGLGEDMLDHQLQAIAGRPDRIKLAPTPESLEEVYASIAREIPCR